MNPHLAFSQLRTTPGRGVIETRYMFILYDIIRLLHKQGYLLDSDMENMRRWSQEFLQWLLESKHGKIEASAKNNHGTYFDVQAASHAAFVGDVESLNKFTLLSQTRLMQQIRSDGSMPEEMSRATKMHYMMFGLQGLFDLARICKKVGVDLWSVKREREHRPLLYMAASELLREDRSLEMAQEGENPLRLLPIYYAAIHQYPEMEGRVNDYQYAKFRTMYEVLPLFDQYSGIAPFW
jgi:hypothetical protein